MKKSLKVKRQAVSVNLHAGCRAIEVGTHELLQALRVHNAEGSEKHNPLRGALTEKEFRLIRQRRDKINEAVADLRKIANSIQRSATDHV